MKTLQTIGERALIERLVSRLAGGNDVVVGPGDDCAVVRAGEEDWLLTSDPVLEGVHFTAAADPVQIGHKAVARALSDIAAMGGVPRWALVDVVAPGETEATRLDAIYDGMAATAAKHGLVIVGGDVAQGPVLELHLFAVGSVPRGGALLRSAARPGDAIYVTGTLGGSHISGRHLEFVPRLREGQWLREEGWVTAMCDISDGLSTDLHHLVDASGVGAEVEIATIPPSDAARTTDDPISHALEDGEDFELLFTVPADKEDAFAAAWAQAHTLSCTRIGTIRTDRRIEGVDPEGNRAALTVAGYDHFAGEESQS